MSRNRPDRRKLSCSCFQSFSFRDFRHERREGTPLDEDDYPLERDSLERLPDDLIAHLLNGIDSIPKRLSLLRIGPIIEKNIFKNVHLISPSDVALHQDCILWDSLVRNRGNLRSDDPQYLQSKSILQDRILPGIKKIYFCIASSWIYFLKLISNIELNLKILILHFAPAYSWDIDFPDELDLHWRPTCDYEEFHINSILNNVLPGLECLTLFHVRHVPPSVRGRMVNFILNQIPTLKALTLQSIEPLIFPEDMPFFEQLTELHVALRTQHCVLEFEQKLLHKLILDNISSIAITVKFPEVDLRLLPIWIRHFQNAYSFSLELKYGLDSLTKDELYFKSVEKQLGEIAQAIKTLVFLNSLELSVVCRADIDSKYHPPRFNEVTTRILSTNLATVRRLSFLLPPTLYSFNLTLNPVFPVDSILIDFLSNQSMRTGDWEKEHFFSIKQQRCLRSVKHLFLKDIHGVTPLLYKDIERCFPNLERLEISIEILPGEEYYTVSPNDGLDLSDMINVLRNLRVLSFSGRLLRFADDVDGEVSEDYIIWAKIIKQFNRRALANPSKLFKFKFNYEHFLICSRDHFHEDEYRHAIAKTKTCRNFQLY